MRSLDDFACRKLAELDRACLRRTLAESLREDGPWVTREGRRLLSFSCNDYLNLSHHLALKAAATAAIGQYGVGAAASRLVTGNHPLFRELETRLARLKGTEAACVFGSGYLANSGIIPALAGPQDLVLIDELAHACLWAGTKLSPAQTLVFRHNDVAHARSLLALNRARFRHALLVTDGVFSMDGDLAPLCDLGELCTAFDTWLMTDDAHGLGSHRRRPRLGFRRWSRRSCTIANGDLVQGDWRLWRIFVRLAARHRFDENARAHSDLFDRPAPGDGGGGDRRLNNHRNRA